MLEHEEGAREDFEERLKALMEDLSDGTRGFTEHRLGAEHLQVCLLFDGGDTQGAEAGAWDLLREQTRVLGANHTYTLETSWLLGRILMWHGRGTAAFQHLERAHTGFRYDLGKLHPKTLECQVDFALSLEATRSPHASRVLREAFESLRLILGNDHPSTMHARVHGLRLRIEGGERDEVGAELEGTLTVCRGGFGKDHSLTKLCIELGQQLTGARGGRSEADASFGGPPLNALVNRR